MLDALGTFVASAVTGAIGGIGWLVESGRPITWPNIAKRMAGGAILGFLLAMVMYRFWGGDVDGRYHIIGTCGLAALAGLTGKMVWSGIQATVLRGLRTNEATRDKRKPDADCPP